MRFANRENWKRPRPAIAGPWRSSRSWPSAHNNLGTVLYEQDKLDDAAIACLSHRRSLCEPDYAEALVQSGCRASPARNRASPRRRRPVSAGRLRWRRTIRRRWTIWAPCSRRGTAGRGRYRLPAAVKDHAPRQRWAEAVWRGAGGPGRYRQGAWRQFCNPCRSGNRKGQAGLCGHRQAVQLDRRQSAGSPHGIGARLDRALGPAGRTCPHQRQPHQAKPANRWLRGPCGAGLAAGLAGAGIVRSGRPGGAGG